MGTTEERLVTWCNNVSELVEDELANGIDDNENEMSDETGLTFTVVGEMVTIILTLERPGRGGELIQKTVETVVTCRN